MRALADRRIAARRSLSDADQLVAAHIREQSTDWPEAVDVDTGQPVDVAVTTVRARLTAHRATRAVAPS